MSYRIIPGKNAFRLISSLSQEKCYILSKVDGDFIEKEQEFPLQGNEKAIYGIVGTYKLLRGEYLVVITSHKYIDSIIGTKIYQVGSVGVIPYTVEFEEDKKYIKMIKSLLSFENFFYYASPGKYELSCTFQSQASREWKFEPTKEFIWNWKVLPEKAQNISQPHPLFISLVQGSMQKFSTKYFSYFLVSRRARLMAGTRYNRRGVDLDGNAANYVETEQIIIGKDENDVYSHVILRGSIPVIWTQKVDLKYNPKIDTSKSLSKISTNSFKIHFNSLLARHPGVSIMNIDLTKEKGSELPLKEAFKKQVEGLETAMVKYTSFDLHKICGQTRFHKLDLLKAVVEKEMYDDKAVLFSFDEIIQNRILRVNCKDSLDRTNMVQTYFGKMIVEKILQKMGVFKKGEGMNENPVIHQKLISCWSDNGDTISRLYSGSGALRTDVTRKLNGKQTIRGLMADGKKSVFRYYQNNLADGFKQDCIDLVAKNFETLEKVEEKVRPTLVWALWVLFKIGRPNTTPKRRKWFLGMFMCVIWLVWFLVLWKVLFLDGKFMIDEPTILKNEYKKKKKKKKE